MDWSKYQTIYDYVTRLPNDSKCEYSIHDMVSPFEQSICYEDKPNPIHPIEKVHLEFHPIKKERSGQVSVNTQTLWSTVTSLLEETHAIANYSMKKCNTQFVIRELKSYLTEKTMYSFLTGRRVYPLLELLDKPRVDYEKKHQSALGYFLSFLLNKSITINQEWYQWSRECVESSIHLVKNNEGFWSLDNKKKIENV